MAPFGAQTLRSDVFTSPRLECATVWQEAPAMSASAAKNHASNAEYYGRSQEYSRAIGELSQAVQQWARAIEDLAGC